MSNSEAKFTTSEFKQLLNNPGLIKGLEENYFFQASSIQQMVISQGDPERCCVIQAKAVLILHQSESSSFLPLVK